MAAWLAVLSIAATRWSVDFSHDALANFGAHSWAVGTLFLGWVLMVVAMMVPTTLPLLSLFGRMTARRPERGLREILLGGYVLVWVAAGAAMHLGDFGIHRLVAAWPWLAQHTWLIGAGTLALAGAYQFSALKTRCLSRCRTPQSFLRKHWRGGSAGAQALRIGLDHGVYCVGCCWSLMLVMFSVGVGNGFWMLALAAVMLLEKTTAVGSRATKPVGVGLLAAALVTALA
jgi:predicted metal-binding membrane protein